jgi:hypothetical protein
MNCIVIIRLITTQPGMHLQALQVQNNHSDSRLVRDNKECYFHRRKCGFMYSNIQLVRKCYLKCLMCISVNQAAYSNAYWLPQSLTSKLSITGTFTLNNTVKLSTQHILKNTKQ